ncbi:hypothetical protein CPB84DRAFT_1780409, partial [Gymnopilus junonius]
MVFWVAILTLKTKAMRKLNETQLNSFVAHSLSGHQCLIPFTPPSSAKPEHVIPSSKSAANGPTKPSKIRS